MKPCSWLSFAILILLLGCGEKATQTSSGTNTVASTNSSGSLLDAPTDYLRAVGKGQQNAVKTVDTASLNQAIQLFNVDKGRYPTDLNELVKEHFIPQIPAAPYGTKLDYDASSGKVTVVKQ